MQIILNGRKKSISEGLTALGLIDALDLRDRRIAVEVNSEIVVRSALAGHVLHPGDRVKSSTPSAAADLTSQAPVSACAQCYDTEMPFNKFSR